MSNTVLVRTNAYEICWERGSTSQSSGQVVHYDVDIKPLWELKPRRDGTPDIGKTKGMELVMRLQREVAPDIFSPEGAYDGKKNLYSPHKYNFDASQKWVVQWDPSNRRPHPREVEITVNYVKIVSQDTIQALIAGSRQNLDLDVAATTINMLNLFFQSAPRTGASVYTARSFFSGREKKKLRNSPLEIWQGFFQSVRPTTHKLIVNVDVTQGVVLPEQPLGEVCMRYLNVSNVRELCRINESSPNLSKLKVFLRGVKVEIRLAGHRGKRPKAIKDIIPDVGGKTFQKDGEEISIAEHFRRVHRVTIQRGELGFKLGNDGLFPMQVCFAIQQIYKKTNTPDIVREAMALAPRDPRARLQAITNGWQQLSYDQSPFLIGAGISVNAQPIEVEGQFLAPPIIGFSHQVTVTQQRAGQWDVMKKPLLVAGRVSSWAVVDLTTAYEQDIVKFITELWKAMDQRGIQIPRLTKDTIRKCNGQRGPESVRADLISVFQERHPELVIVVLPESAAPLYREVKRFGDIVQGVVTQCIKWSTKLASTHGGALNQYHNNLILKLNVKLEGVNWYPVSMAMEWLKKLPTMILGADVSHPGPGSQLPSVASLVGSVDSQLLRYVAAVRIQASRTEMIADIGAMFEGLLRTFHAKNRVLPKRIIMYRDGVSEGEFEAVRGLELNAMSKIIMNAYGPDKGKWPLIGFVVVGKRHHFRFFPNPQQEDSRGNNNLHAGFVTEKGIDHPLYDDFYLQSQAGLKGTSRPSHYTVLTNNLEISLKNLQEISFALCHCYSRSTRSVKVPAPVYYADLVCRRAKFHFDDDVRGLEDTMSVHSEGDVNLEWYQAHWSDINSQIRERMYFV